jgi:hypothetical protein
MPIWWGDPAYHRAHQAKLYHKDPAHYVVFEEMKLVEPESTYPVLTAHGYRLETRPKQMPAEPI